MIEHLGQLLAALGVTGPLPPPQRALPPLKRARDGGNREEEEEEDDESPRWKRRCVLKATAILVDPRQGPKLFLEACLPGRPVAPLTDKPRTPGRLRVGWKPRKRKSSFLRDFGRWVKKTYPRKNPTAAIRSPCLRTSRASISGVQRGDSTGSGHGSHGAGDTSQPEVPQVRVTPPSPELSQPQVSELGTGFIDPSADLVAGEGEGDGEGCGGCGEREDDEVEHREAEPEVEGEGGGEDGGSGSGGDDSLLEAMKNAGLIASSDGTPSSSSPEGDEDSEDEGGSDIFDAPAFSRRDVNAAAKGLKNLTKLLNKYPSPDEAAQTELRAAVGDLHWMLLEVPWGDLPLARDFRAAVYDHRDASQWPTTDGIVYVQRTLENLHGFERLATKVPHKVRSYYTV